MCLRMSASDFSGILSSIRSIALSINNPVGILLLSLIIIPPSIFFVLELILEISIAKVFVHIACPSILLKTIGCSFES